MKSEGVEDRIGRCLDAMIDGRLSIEDAEWLEATLPHDAELRLVYLEMVELHAALSDSDFPSSNGESIDSSASREPLSKRDPGSSGVTRPRGDRRNVTGTTKAPRDAVNLRLWATACVATVAALVVAGVSVAWRTTPPPGDSVTIARLVRSKGAAWDRQFATPTAGDRLFAGRLRLVSGSALLAFDSGAVIDMDGPVDLQLDDRFGGRLLSGTVVVDTRRADPEFRMRAGRRNSQGNTEPPLPAIDPPGEEFVLTVDPVESSGPEDDATPIHRVSATYWVSSPQKGSIQKRETERGPSFRIFARDRLDKPWDVQFMSYSEIDILRGDQIEFAYMCRTFDADRRTVDSGTVDSTSADSMTGERLDETLGDAPPGEELGRFDVFARRTITEDLAAAIYQRTVEVGQQWTAVSHRFIAPMDIPAGRLKISMHFATQRQTIDLASPRLLHHGPSGRSVDTLPPTRLIPGR